MSPRALLVTVLALLGATSCDRTIPDAPPTARLQPGAAERRFALVVGNNRGSALRTALRYAERDAARVARVLTELGHFATRDVYLHQGHSAGDLRARLGDLRRTIARAKADSPATRALVVLYFSGHSDGVALELGNDRLPFADLRSLLGATGADVRIGLLDTCRSGAAIGLKGGALVDGYDLSVTTLPALSGEAFLSASRSDEVALEARDIEASLFSMHLVSGLRGAADADVDGVVTLDELYRHTSVRTSGAAAETLYGTQTPAYDYRLIGQGQLVLSYVAESRHHLFLPPGFDRIVVSDARGEPQAEVRLGSTARLAVAPGIYRARGLRDG
ncbi:MAG TPA: caspase family protein, partial [Polyangia bacterium]